MKSRKQAMRTATTRHRSAPDGAKLESGGSFWRGGGWATKQILRQLNQNPHQLITAQALRICADDTDDFRAADGVLQRDEWIFFDDAIQTEVARRLTVVADIIAAGNTINVPGALGKTLLEYEKTGDLHDAIVSMDGMTRDQFDILGFTSGNLPLPIVHKDFFFNIRTLIASRNTGEAIDTTHARVAGRKVAEKVEDMTVNGGPQFGSSPIYGLLTHPDRVSVNYQGGGNIAWNNAGKTGENILTDVQYLIQQLNNNSMYGPYILYVSRDSSVGLGSDFKAASDKSIRTRLLELDGLQAIKTSDFLPATTVVLVQMTADVVQIVNGEEFQTVQWEVGGGMGINMKAFAIQVPLVRSGPTVDQSGIAHMHL